MASFFSLVTELETLLGQLNIILAGAEDETVEVNGVTKDSISKAIRDKFSAIQAMVQGRLSFENKAALDAFGAPANSELAEVWDDSLELNNGLYGYKGGAWVKSPYDRLTNVSKELTQSSSALDHIFGLTRNKAENAIQGQAVKYADGTQFSASGWECTDYIPVSNSSYIVRDALILIGQNTSVASIAFYDASYNYLGYYNNQTTSEVVLISEHFPSAAYIRACNVIGNDFTLTVEQDIESKNVKGLDDLLDTVSRTISKNEAEAFDDTNNQRKYLNLQGELVTAQNWIVSDFIAVKVDDAFTYSGQSSSIVSSVAGFDDGLNFVEVLLTNTLAGEEHSLKVTNPAIKFVRASASFIQPHSFKRVTTFVDKNQISGISNELEKINKYLLSKPNHDFSDDLMNGYISKSGEFVEIANNWGATDFIPCSNGDIFTYTGGSSSITLNMALYDENKDFIKGLPAAQSDYENLTVRVDEPNAAYIRASFKEPETSQKAFLGTKVYTREQGEPEDKLTLKYIAPSEVFALKGEPIYLNARGILADRTVPLAWNFSQSSEEVAKINPATTDDINIKLKARNHNGNQAFVADITVKVSDVPVSPSNPENFICLGDSLTEGFSNSGIQGAYSNELSRRLTGIGKELLSGAQSPAPLALSNIYFRGTRGDQAVKHEGRGGWRPSDYLNNASVNGVTNAFWNPSTSEFDIDYYLQSNNFDWPSIDDGVISDGSNLTMIILLGWNDVYKTTAESSWANTQQLINKVKEKKPQTRFIIVGLNPAPKLNHKSFSGERWVSELDVFESAVYEFGKAYKAGCEELDNCEFLQLSAVFNPEFAYNRSNVSIGIRTSEVVSAVTDHVHPNEQGYAQLADALFYNIIYRYCQ
ncbi:MAG: hypothetical protein CMK63_07110 [Pseudoalteromonadaceae bacterium]|nr:hypothetical protein [Gemmatimonadota bacterium]MBU76745.1 hypothetical protein [Pseudoalteromonadaceae bacterium]|tara:strand:- start:2675 stop:5293 length:2619 start_codon:yes stop_codon:yes gene_type:complete